MKPFEQLGLLLDITRSSEIARRYFVTNGFDGTLTMLGLALGFRLGGEVPLSAALSACLATAIALGMSGLSSAYISETAERKKELRDLEQAMLTRLDDSAHARAAMLAPLFIAVVNCLAPLTLALLIMTPIWLAYRGMTLPLPPFDCAIVIAFVLIFLMGVFLGRVSGRFWLWAGLRALAIAAVTTLIILLLKI